MLPRILTLALAALLAACSGQASNEQDDEQVNLRNLVGTEKAGERPAQFKVEGDPIPTPSDAASRYFLLRNRTTMGGSIISIIRQERGGKVVYARTETDCAHRLFHIVGTADRRDRVETDVAHDGPLRPIAGLPLREELASFVCQRSGRPLERA